MPLPSGTYNIKNIGCRNYVTLPNENDDRYLVAGSNIDANAPLVTAKTVWLIPC
jgi:hypothetical protein